MTNTQVNKNARSIAVLSEQMQSIRSTVDRIENNHLVHLDEKIQKLATQCDERFTAMLDKIDVLENIVTERTPMASLGMDIIKTMAQAIVISVLIVIGLSVT